MEKVTDFILRGSKITADGDYSHEIKRHLPLGRKVMTNLDSVFKSRDITLSERAQESIKSSALSLLNGPTLTSIHDYWKNHSFEYTDHIYRHSNVSAF